MRTKPVPEDKTAVNLRIRRSLKERARKYGVNLSRTLERTLEEEVTRRDQEAWMAENRAAIEAYNERVEARGPALISYRSF